MTRRALALAVCGLLLTGCVLRPSPPLPPIDCAEVDRAEERFPDLCGEDPPPDEDDAGSGDEGDAGAGDDDGSDAGSGDDDDASSGNV